MERLPPPAPGFIRIAVHLRPGISLTPGALAAHTGLSPDHVSHAAVHEGIAHVDVLMEHGRSARTALEPLGRTNLVDWEWRWLRLSVGRNHGLTIGQLRKIMQTIEAVPLGKITINNTHTLVGVQDFKLPGALKKLEGLRVNGFAPRPEVLPSGKGPGSPEFTPA